MPEVLTTKDGKNHTLFSNRDFAYLIVDYMGYDAENYFRRLMDDITACHNEIRNALEDFDELDADAGITAILDSYGTYEC